MTHPALHNKPQFEYSITSPNLTITVYDGSEGPIHDPTEFRRYEVKNARTCRTVILHTGFTTYLKLGGTLLECEDPHAFFEVLVGLTSGQIERIHNKLIRRCYACGRTNEGYWVNGYPGESIKLCLHCDAAMDYHFNEGAII